MHIRFTLPQKVFLYGPAYSDFDIKAVFTHKRYRAVVCLSGGAVETSRLPLTSSLMGNAYRPVEAIQITLSDSEKAPPLSDFWTQPRHTDLLKLINGLAMRVLNVIRHIGGCPEIKSTFPLDEDKVQRRFTQWKVDFSEDQQTWQPVAGTIPNARARLETLFDLGILDNTFAAAASLQIDRWPRIAEILEDNRSIPPEEEFYTNTVGHLKERNFRLAVLEAIICLEIVLTEFLQAHLEVSKGLDAKVAKKFLKKIDLEARLIGLLALTLHESYLSELPVVQSVVGWRNGITHEHGHLPSVSESDLISGVQAVLNLAKGLAERRDGIRAQPELDKIGDKLKAKHSMLVRTFRQLPWHEIKIVLEFFSPCPTKAQLEALIAETEVQLKLRDVHFDATKHLTMECSTVTGELLAQYRLGGLESLMDAEGPQDTGFSSGTIAGG